MWYALVFLFAVICCNAEKKGNHTFLCNGPVNKTDGWLVPENFSTNGTCIWSISNVVVGGILVFENFYLHENETLNLSSLSFSGHKEPFSVVLENNTEITLISKDLMGIKERFRAYFNSSGCLYVLPKDMKSLTSPIYKMEQNIKCRFHIPEAGYAYMSSVAFNQFSLINSILSIEGSNFKKNYTGTAIPPDVFANGSLNLIFHLKENSSNSFSISLYNVLKACSGYINLDGTTQSAEVKGSPEAQQSVESDAECRTVIESNNNTVIGFKFTKLSLLNGFDQLSFIDGQSINSKKTMLIVNSLNQNVSKDEYIISSKNYMFVSFRPFDVQSDFMGIAEMIKSDRHMYSSEGNISLTRNNTEPRVIFLLDIPDDDKKVFLMVNPNKTTLLPAATLRFFNGFSINSPLATLSQNKIYPVVASSSKMMVIAENFINSTFAAYFKSIFPGCYEMSSGNSGAYLLSGYCNKNCSWIINSNATTDDILALDISKLGNNDRVHIHLLDAKMSSLATYSANDTFIPEIYIPANVGASVTVERGDKCRENETSANFYASYIIKKNCNEVHKLSLPQTYQISSPNYPNTYPVLADCWWNLTSSFPAYVLVTFSKLQLAAGHCLKVFTHKNGTNITLVGNYSSQLQIPDDIFTELNTSLQFKSSPCINAKNETRVVTASGYLLNLTATDCGGLYTEASGNFSTSVNKTLCVWMVKVPSSDKVVNIIKFKVLEKNGNAHTDLKVYDGSTLRSPIIDNITGEILSRTNTVIFIYQNLTKAASSINITYSSKTCNSSSLCDNGICLHPDWRCNGVNDCGDYSDEQNCTYVPDHGGSGSNTNYAGVSPVAVGVVIPLIFAAGILCAIGVPYLLRRYRGGRYQQFRDVSVTD